MRLGDHLHQAKIGDLNVIDPEESTRGMVDEVVQADIVVLKRQEVQLSRFRNNDVLGLEGLEDGHCAAQDLLTNGFRVHLRIRHNSWLRLASEVDLTLGLDMSSPTMRKIRWSKEKSREPVNSTPSSG